MLGYYTLAGALASAPLILASPIALAVFPRLTALVASRTGRGSAPLPSNLRTGRRYRHSYSDDSGVVCDRLYPCLDRFAPGRASKRQCTRRLPARRSTAAGHSGCSRLSRSCLWLRQIEPACQHCLVYSDRAPAVFPGYEIRHYGRGPFVADRDVLHHGALPVSAAPALPARRTRQLASRAICFVLFWLPCLSFCWLTCLPSPSSRLLTLGLIGLSAVWARSRRDAPYRNCDSSSSPRPVDGFGDLCPPVNTTR